jgi:hypothetical protein
LKEITMSDRNTMAQRGRDLEDAFFHDVDLKLIEELRAASKNKASRLALAKEAGISDERLAEELVELDVTPESLVAIRLVPLVMVAWADREVSDEERDTMIAEARRLGIHPGTVADKMLDSWLRKRPSQVLCDAWARYTRSLLLDIPYEIREAYVKEIKREMLAVARASGGMMGFGSVNDRELDVLERMTELLDQTV